MAELARRQHGLITRGQLLAVLSETALNHRVARGRLHRIHRGVYAVGHRALTPDGHLLAATLSLGEAAAISHLSAAHFWGLLRQPSRIHVTTPGRPRPRTGVVVHRDPRLSDADRVPRRGVPVTHVPRTLVDLAATHPDLVRRATNQALRDRATSLGYLLAYADASRLPGVARFRSVLAHAAPTASELEDRVLQVLEAAGLPRPLVNDELLGLPRRAYPDFRWPPWRLILEADGGRWHDNPIARADDVERQVMIEDAHHRVLRTDWAETVREPQRLVARVWAASRHTAGP